jgi:hypothetical protein
MRTTDSGPLQQLQAALAGLTRVDPRDVSDESVRSALPALLTAFHQLAAVVSGVVGAFDARDLSQLDAGGEDVVGVVRADDAGRRVGVGETGPAAG